MSKMEGPKENITVLRSGVGSLQMFHDNHRGITCYVMTDMSGGISCVKSEATK